MSPQNAPPRLRKRAFKPRAATGCKTCRIRRIKCDEAQPSCRQCHRGRRICDGYSAKDSTERQIGQTAISLITPPLSPTLSDVAQENRCFEFFRRHTVSRLAGTFESPFWSRMLLQAAHYEPAIRHAAVALGSLHECAELEFANVYEHDEVFALQQYSKAIALVTSPIREGGKQAADVALMTCALFVCFEIFRGCPSAALSHIDGGVKIVAELQSSQHDGALCLLPIPYVSLPILNQVFSRLDTQASQVTHGRRRHLLSQGLSIKETGYDPDIPTSFESFDSARNSLDYIRTCATMREHSLPNSFTSEISPGPTVPVEAADIKLSLDLIRNSSIIRLKQWSSAFKAFLQDKHNLSQAERKAAAILKLHRVMIGLTFGIDIARAMEDEMIWDQYLPSFKDMISYAEEVIEPTSGDKRKSPTFTLDTEVILPLCFVAAKCRDGTLRRKAIALLRQEQRGEGILSSGVTARIAERLVEIEEEGINEESIKPEEVMRWKRVGGIVINFDTEQRRASLKYIKQSVNGGGEEILEWVDWEGNRTRSGCKILIGPSNGSHPQPHQCPPRPASLSSTAYGSAIYSLK